ncbi:MAG: octaprenyl-diphosphate synthase [Planctomycetota bacterium]|jgi:octaprenyl-diphosphate synthase
MPTTDEIEQSYRLVQPHMDALDVLMSEILSADVECVDDMLKYAGRYSGKRLRPALVFIIGGMCGETNDKHVRLGAVVELIHMATLVHDDVLDRATVRRNHESVNIRWNNKDAILLGDIMFARAIRLLVTIGNMRALDLLTGAVSTICEGEIQQNQLSGDFSVDFATYEQIIQRKTASLYAAGCELAALLGGAREELVAGFSEFGMSLGTAFQIIDDCLDLTGDESVVGKSLGTDIKNGKMTLPLIHLLSKLAEPEKSKVEELIQRDNCTDEEVVEIRELLSVHGSIEHAFTLARKYVQDSLEPLRDLLPARDFTVVQEIAGFVLERRQ